MDDLLVGARPLPFSGRGRLEKVRAPPKLLRRETSYTLASDGGFVRRNTRVSDSCWRKGSRALLRLDCRLGRGSCSSFDGIPSFMPRRGAVKCVSAAQHSCEKEQSESLPLNPKIPCTKTSHRCSRRDSSRGYRGLGACRPSHREEHPTPAQTLASDIARHVFQPRAHLALEVVVAREEQSAGHGEGHGCDAADGLGDLRPH